MTGAHTAFTSLPCDEMTRPGPRAVVLALLLALLCAAPAQAGPGAGPTAVVSLGDSYISGEAGRWAGNSVTPVGDKSGTDRACQPAGPTCQVDKSRVYVGGSDANGCHRSDVAEIISASIAVAERINLACSGGQTKNIFRAASGGVGQNGEQPQGDQLLPVARAKDVKLIVLSIGGNDLGFADIVASCLTSYATRTGPCEPKEQPGLDAKIPAATAAVGKAIDEIRAVMSDAGYTQGQYRLVLQTYPSVVPRAAEARYTENDPQRASQGCPFYDQDLTWARDRAAPQIGSMVKAAAASRGTEVLELRDALQGHEICSVTAKAATPVEGVDAASGEWGRFTGASTVQQGDLQEAFHPNAFAQRALGTCLTGVFAAAPGQFACSGGAGRDPSAMSFARTGDVPAAGTTGTAGGPGTAGSVAPGCVPANGFRSFAVRPSGRGLRFVVRRAQSRTFRVDVFQQSAGRRVLGNRRVARFTRRRGTFSWSGRARGIADGAFVVRATMALPGGRTDVRRLAVRRVRGRFIVDASYYRRASCGQLTAFKLERPVFGGARNRALGIAFRVARTSRVGVVVSRGGRVVRRFRTTTRRGRVTHRLRLPSERLARGTYRVRITVTPPSGPRVTATLSARRL